MAQQQQQQQRRRNTNQLLVPGASQALNQLKYEIAQKNRGEPGSGNHFPG